MTQDHFEKVYETSSDPKAQEQLYDDWAAAYDDDLRSMGCVTPDRLADALSSVLTDRDVPILDYGCGTGLAGEALAARGYTNIDGSDLSAGMLAAARTKGVYRQLSQSEPGVLDVDPGIYDAIVACGVVTTGAAPASTLDLLASRLDDGALLAFTYNDHALADSSYTDKLAELLDGDFDELVNEHGPHLPKLGLEATVYVLRKRG